MLERRELKGRLRLLAHFAAYKLRHPRRRPGYVSVVLPVYGVEAFVGECLESLLKQGYRRLDIVVVDDGSLDGSVDVVREFMRRDPRIRLVQQENRGLSGARNAGVKHARGEYLAFLDSDDTIEPHAYATAVASLRASGSDFAVFSYRRLDNGKFVQPGRWIRDAHRELLQGVTVTGYPDILVNAVAWSKVYRRDFWDRAGLKFPEGALYEDQPVSAAAYLKASALDVLPQQFVNWRVRDDGQSISQQVRELRDLEQRLDSASSALSILAANPVAHRARLGQILTNDVRHSARAIPRASEEFYALLRSKLRPILALLDDQGWEAVAAPMKIVFQLIEEHPQQQTADFVEDGGLSINNYLTQVRDGRLVCDLASIPSLDVAIDPWRTVLSRAESQLEAIVRRGWWDDDGNLHLIGWSLIANVEDAAQRIEVALTGGGGPAIAFDVSQDSDDEVQLVYKHRHYTYPGSHYQAILPADRVPTEGSWAVGVTATSNGIERSGPFRSFRDLRSDRQLSSRRFEDGRDVQLVESKNLDLSVVVLPPAPSVTSLTLDGDSLVVELDTPVESLRLRGTNPLTFTVAPGGAVWTARLAEWVAQGSAVADLIVSATLTAGLAGGSRRDVRWPRGQDFAAVGVVGPAAIARDSASDGVLKLSAHRRLATLDAYAYQGNALTLRGFVHGLGARPTVMVVRQAQGVGDSADVGPDGTYEVTLQLDAGQWGFAGTTLPRGAYGVRLRGEADEEEPVIPRMSRASLDTLPFDHATPTMRVRTIGSRARNPLVSVRPLVAEAERSMRGIEELRTSFANTTPPIREKAVLFRTFYGENTTCCGRGIHRELVARGADLELYWTITDHSVPIPEGGRGVVAGSREWYELMRSAKYLVDNVHQPDFFVKRPEQVFLETFHGYPFKQMGLDYWREHGYSQGRIDSFLRRAADWTYVLSPATYATPLLQEAFGFTGEMLELGYPRNDIFFAPDADVLGQEIRARLGIAPGALVVLYAPTYRDWLSSTEFVAPIVDYFDYDEFSRAFGDEAVLLLRGHAMNARHKNRVESDGAIIDVTDYPEINDLILAADVAVVDYSSIRFDLGVAGKPMIFLVPDLDRYKGDRGSLMEYEPTAPGPLVSTTAEVIAHLKDLEGLRADYAEAYEAFRAAYLDLDDGHAGARVVDAVFGPAAASRTPTR